MRPKWRTALSARACTASASVTSVGMPSARPPSAWQASATGASVSALRAASTTRAPRRAKASAVAWPMPLEAPVITTTGSGGAAVRQCGAAGGVWFMAWYG
ncbi:hypothetical protein ALISP_5306 [Alicycliphilus sp. B1]|nr:hypothetical protein ALISP_5306 [Alicycliphilus sp. B1]